MSKPKDEPELPPEILKQIIQVDPERYQQMMDAPFQTHPSQLTWLVYVQDLKDRAEADIDACVEQLRNEKRYLFGQPAETVTPRRTAGAKDRVTHNQTALQHAATKAARSGNRTDLQHYLKLRRNLL